MTATGRVLPALMMGAALAVLASCLPRRPASPGAAEQNSTGARSGRSAAVNPDNPEARTATFALG